MAITQSADLITNHPVIGEVEFGIGERKVPQAAHVAYFWETEREFADGVCFLEAGLRGLDQCVIFGYEEANQAVCNILQNHGFAVKDLLAQQRITIVGGDPSGEKILGMIRAAFQQALARGAPLIRLLGNIGWGKPGWPGDYDLLAVEAKVTAAAKEFPCVVLCMYDVGALPGLVIRPGAYGTHPLIDRDGSLQENPEYIPADFFLKHLDLIADALSQRRQAQAESRSNEERFRSLFDHSIDAVLIADPHGNIEAANPEACRMFGRTEEEICRIGRMGLVDPADTRLQVLLAEREQTGRFKGELNFRRKDDSAFLGEVSSAFYKDKSGVSKASVIIRDITERKRAEQRLILQHTVTQMLAEAITFEEVTPKILQTVCEFLLWEVGVLWRVDAQVGVLRCVQVWHMESVKVPQFEAISRQSTFMPGIGLPGRLWSSHEPAYIPDVVDDANFPRASVARSEGLHAAFGFPIMLGGDVVGVMEFFVRERRQSEHELLSVMAILGSQIGQFIEGKRAQEKLRKSQADLAHVTRVATLGEMSGSIAHEVNQPLAAAVTSASACLRWLDAEKLEEARRSASRAIAEVHRASEIIGRIRSLTKKAPPQKAWLDINETIHEVIALARNEIQRNGVALETELSEHVPLILADRIELQQLILNLVMNGIEAMDMVTDRPREMVIRSSAHGSDKVLVAVQDSGVGIDSQTLDKMFDTFYTTKPQGMGMGLAISRSIVENHDGSLWATANPDKGATFQFTLPTGGGNQHD
jgi:PAS domain S-box-containing protein